jgi:hypothetical protein
MALTQIAQRQHDRASRTGFGTSAMPNTTRTMHDYGLPMAKGQNVVFRTGSHACAASDALCKIDLRVQQPRLVCTQGLCFDDLSVALGVSAKLRAPNRQQQHCDSQQQSRPAGYLPPLRHVQHGCHSPRFVSTFGGVG